MSRLELLEFQQTAAERLIERALAYYTVGPDRVAERPIPFIGQLKAVTGAGKTPILAHVIGRLQPAIVLWTTKFSSVVDQTFINLRPGGKYNHLLGTGSSEVLKFSEIPSASEWHRILEAKHGLTILVSTVAAWNSTEKDERLNVHKHSGDWGAGTRWEQIRQLRGRPLWIVYDEAHNTTTEQVELLDELDPAGFFVASASPIKGKLQQYLTLLPEAVRRQRIVPVSTRAVVEAQLLKSTIAVADYEGSTLEMLREVAQRRQRLEKALQTHHSKVVPKAIYVVETSNTKSDEGVARPAAIWGTLVNQAGVAPNTIAVCTSTRNLPKDAIRVQRIEQLGPDLTHIIFNKRLQEGWDDPAVYVCYFDGKTDSATRIQQVIGRALRQPDARHLADEDLNTAFFYIQCRSEALDSIVEELKEELRIYKEGEVDDFEPFEIRDERRVLPRIPVKEEWAGKLRTPKLTLELPSNDPLGRLLRKRTIDFGEEDRAAPGRAIVNIVSVRTGDVQQVQRDLFEDMRARCGTYLQQQIRSLSRDCVNAMHPDLFSTDRLEKTACYNSKALMYYREIALALVEEYENRVRLTEEADPDEREYVVGSYQPSSTGERHFTHAAHAFYDLKSFNPDELRLARALDHFPDYVWARNKARLDYGIPLPKKSGGSSTFFPDFLWWVKDTVWAVDPTAKFILDEKIRTKLFAVPPPLRIALATPGKFENGRKIDDEGWTLHRLRLGTTGAEVFDSPQELLETLVADSG